MGKTKLNPGRKKVVSVRSHLAPLETDAGTLPSKLQPRSDIQISRNGLNEDVKVIQYEARANRPSSNLVNIVSVWLFWV